MFLVDVRLRFKMLTKYCLCLNCSKFPKKANELQMHMRKSRGAWENESRKGNIET